MRDAVQKVPCILGINVIQIGAPVKGSVHGFSASFSAITQTRGRLLSACFATGNSLSVCVRW